MFTSSPQSVEVHQAGTWWSGELLGWRHDASGTCQMWVRVVVGGVEEAAWIDLAALRLPEEASPTTGRSRIDPRVKQELPPAQAVSALRGRAASTEATVALPMVRDEPVAADGDAVPVITVTRPGGRRRAPEDAEVHSVVAARVPVPAGRHRAPDDDEGRHRAADTEVFAAITDETDRFAALPGRTDSSAEPRRSARAHAGVGRSVPTARAARPEESYGRAEVCTGRIDAEPDLLTRPMRLSDLAPNTRRPQVSGSRPAT